MSLDHYTKSRVVGKGSYGEVWLVKHKKDRKQYVLKKLDLHNAATRERKAAEQEAKLLSKLKHPNIVSYKDSFEGPGDGYLYIAMGYCEGGDLYNKLKESRGSPLDERQVVEWFVQIAMALQYMHERNILHRDLKTQNIFLTKSKIIKVGDLGIARVLDSSSDMATTLIGTPYYMSPELFSNRPYNHKSDVWALGCCVYEMTTLKHAFNAKDMNSLVYKILRGKMPIMPKMYCPELVNLIKAMLNQNPDRRPSVNRILRDPYIKKNIALFLEGTKKSRRPSGSSSREDSVDGKRLDSGAKVKREQERKRLQAKPLVIVEDNLEPLNLGPDLAPIVEELDATGGSQKSVASSASKPRQPSSSPNRHRDNNNPRSTPPPPLAPRLRPSSSSSSAAATADCDRNDVAAYTSPKRSTSPRVARPSSAGGGWVRGSSGSGSESAAVVVASGQYNRRQASPSASVSRSSPKLGRGGTTGQSSSGTSDKSLSRDRERKESGDGDSGGQMRQQQDAVSRSLDNDSDPTKPRLKKKKRLKERLAERRNQQQEEKASPASSAVLKSSSSSSGGGSPKPRVKRASPEEKSRPLPPPPVVATAGPSKSSSNRESGGSSGDLREEDPDATPRKPPVSARERRRMQRSDVETPRTARSVDLDQNKRLVDVFNPRRKSEDYDQLRRADISSNKQQLRPRSAANNSSSSSSSSRQPQNKSSVPLKPPPVVPRPTYASPAPAPTRGVVRIASQPSIPDSSSSSSSSSSEEEDEDEEEEGESHAVPGQKARMQDKRRKDKEMNNFISLLNTTLKMDKSPPVAGDDDEEDEEEKTLVVEEQPTLPQAEPARRPAGITYTKSSPSLAGNQVRIPVIDDVPLRHNVSQPDLIPPTDAKGEITIKGGKSMTSTGRLWERITMLRKDCIRGLGVNKLKFAYDILDNVDSEEMEPKLISLLGQDDFDFYAGKIWQLKFCEEAAFGMG